MNPWIERTKEDLTRHGLDVSPVGLDTMVMINTRGGFTDCGPAYMWYWNENGDDTIVRYRVVSGANNNGVSVNVDPAVAMQRLQEQCDTLRMERNHLQVRLDRATKDVDNLLQELRAVRARAETAEASVIRVARESNLNEDKLDATIARMNAVERILFSHSQQTQRLTEQVAQLTQNSKI
jgi:methyl-accepting chemotaxis protein